MTVTVPADEDAVETFAAERIRVEWIMDAAAAARRPAAPRA